VGAEAGAEAGVEVRSQAQALPVCPTRPSSCWTQPTGCVASLRSPPRPVQAPALRKVHAPGRDGEALREEEQQDHAETEQDAHRSAPAQLYVQLPP
jgi:hypothetical protein